MFLYQENLQEGVWVPSAEQLRHIKARRLSKGDQLTLFDGQGKVATVMIENFSKKEVSCNIGAVTQHEHPNLPRLVLGVTKIPALEFILQKATEIGVSEIVLLVCQYTPIAFDQQLFSKKEDRWRKIVLSACEQSENVFVPGLRWMSFHDYLSYADNPIMFHPYADQACDITSPMNGDLVIGPEGGFSEEECNQLSTKVKLNTGVLRADTAAIAALLLYQMTKH